MVYRLLYYFANIIIRLYYRKFYVNGLDLIPKDKPLLIVSNHPNGFLEPIIMACLFPIELHFLVRGDLFENKLLRWLLVATNQVPIYRFRDGIAALRNNQKTIEKTIDVLQKNKAIIIFAEGSTKADWMVRPLKKGMARMAFQCLDGSPQLDLHILPVGITFEQGEKSATDVILNIGQPFSVHEFYTEQAKLAKDKMDELTNYTATRIEQLIIHLQDQSHKIDLRNQWHAYVDESYKSYLPKIEVGHKLITMLKQDEHLLNIGTKLSQTQKEPFSFHRWYLVPIAVIGLIFWFIPLYLSSTLTKKFVKQLEFISSVKAATTGFLCLIHLVITIIAIWIIFNIKWALIILIIALFSGFILAMVWENLKILRNNHLRT